ncbi:MAG: ATPase domain-containing protein [Candidatus Jordarchaeaceae archaeon]
MWSAIWSLNVPQELVQALESRTFSLHIKGNAGTGKTTLALELAKLFPVNCKAVYLSTHISLERLYEQFPWSEPCIRQENVLDANADTYPDTKQEALFEYVDKPNFMRSLYSKVMGSRDNIIIVDSLNTLKSNLKIPFDDFSIENDILEIANRLNAKVLFISELLGESKLDYVVDGVLRLEKEIVDGRLLRKLYIEKIRGAKIENPTYLFTLKDGRFTCFDKGIKMNLVMGELPRIEKREDKKIPTLIPELDKILGGGFERGTFNIFSIDDKVGTNYTNIINSIVLSFVLQGIPSFYFPSKGTPPTQVNIKNILVPPGEIFTFHWSEEAREYLKKCFYMVYYQKNRSVNENEEFNTYTIRGEDLDEHINEFTEFVTKKLNEVKAENICILMSSDIFDSIYGSENFTKATQTWIDHIRKMNGTSIMFYFRNEKLKPPLHLASSYFKIENIDGNIVFYGEIPKTKMYIIGINISKNYAQINLIPIE